MGQYIGEIRIFAGNFPPSGWAMCDGQLLSIEENETMFTLTGTTYGGDGETTFALPDLRGKSPMHQGADQFVGETGAIVLKDSSSSHRPDALDPAPLIAPGSLTLSFIISLEGIHPSPNGGRRDEPFLAEGRLFAFNFAPGGWAQCNGQLLPINQNQALFSLLGTTYGGNGQTTFALPDLRGSIPMHPEAGVIGEELEVVSTGPLNEASIDFLVLNYCIALQGIFPSEN